MKRGRARLAGFRNTDVFAAGNLLLLLGWTLFAILSGGDWSSVGNVLEFSIYAVGIFAIVAIGWLLLRRWSIPSGLLALIELGLLAHFAGAFVPVEGGRLYESHLLGLRIDAYVHFLNAVAGAALIGHLLRIEAPALPAAPVIVVGLVLGAGSLVETIEYLAFLTVPDTGVGGYANNMQDLAANLAGAVLVVLLREAVVRLRPAWPSE